MSIVKRRLQVKREEMSSDDLYSGLWCPTEFVLGSCLRSVEQKTTPEDGFSGTRPQAEGLPGVIRTPLIMDCPTAACPGRMGSSARLSERRPSRGVMSRFQEVGTFCISM